MSVCVSVSRVAYSQIIIMFIHCVQADNCRQDRERGGGGGEERERERERERGERERERERVIDRLIDGLMNKGHWPILLGDQSSHIR